MNPFSPLDPNLNYNFANIQNAYKMLMNAQNPMAVFSQLAGQNPQMQPILNMLNQGVNPQKIFNSMCQQRGINPQTFLNNITNNNRR